MKKFVGATVINKITGENSAKIGCAWVGNCPAINCDSDIDCLFDDPEKFEVYVWGKNWEKKNY